MPDINYTKYIYSTTKHYIENCGHDENKKYKGGKAGDQTGDEMVLRTWYPRPWTCVLHYPDPDVRMLIARLAIASALNNCVGYDQSQRTTFWKELVKANYNPSAIKTPCEGDCTSTTTAIVKAAGELCDIAALKSLPISITSRNMRNKFAAAGFIVRTDSRYLNSPSYLAPGDILLYDGHHAAINVTVGKNSTDGEETTVLITGNSVYVRAGASTAFPFLGVVHRGDKFGYLNEQVENGSGWYKVNYKNTPGWVSRRYSRLL